MVQILLRYDRNIKIKYPRSNHIYSLGLFFFQVAVDGESYHKTCFRCTHGGCIISPSNYVAHEHRLYCRHHHTQIFKQKGNFSQFDKIEQVQGWLRTQHLSYYNTIMQLCSGNNIQDQKMSVTILGSSICLIMQVNKLYNICLASL